MIEKYKQYILAIQGLKQARDCLIQLRAMNCDIPENCIEDISRIHFLLNGERILEKIESINSIAVELLDSLFDCVDDYADEYVVSLLNRADEVLGS